MDSIGRRDDVRGGGGSLRLAHPGDDDHGDGGDHRHHGLGRKWASDLIGPNRDGVGPGVNGDGRQPPQPGDVPITFADISKARAKLGYNPQVKIAAGIPRFVDWFRQTVQ